MTVETLRLPSSLIDWPGRSPALKAQTCIGENRRFFGLAGNLNASDILAEFDQAVRAKLREVGFRATGASGSAFLGWVRDTLEALLREHLNNADDAIASPSLTEQVEADEEVKAARRHYGAVYERVYAEARKRL